VRALLQRVSKASVSIDGKTRSRIGPGLLILLGVEEEDTMEDVLHLTYKITRLRIFDDQAGKMNLPITDVFGNVMVISQFTLFASTKKGNRPSFTRAARPEFAKMMYDFFVKQLEKELSITIATGSFGSRMKVSLANEGPVTILLDSKSPE
jgi:D-aminoacyl-tRNA deacylase